MQGRSLQPGDSVGAYQITGMLGAGGMGEVYRAFDPRLNRALALKVLPAELVANRERVRRFVLEAQAASALNHPHIITIYEVGILESYFPTGEPLHFMAMELVEGQTLRAVMSRGTPVSELLVPLAQVADALARAHASGLIHRDLKPENVMLTSDGYAKVLDFGLAKLVDSSAFATGSDAQGGQHAATAVMTQVSGAVMGTLGYMSPEQVLSKPLDGRSDVFAMGCILYEAATGTVPFAGQSAVDTMHKIAYSEPQRPVPPIDPELYEIIRRCLAKSPDERYASARELADALRRLDRRTSDDLPRADARRGGRRAVVAAAVLVLVVALVASLLLRRRDEQPPPRRAEETSALRLSRLTNHGKARLAEISADGQYVVVVVQRGGDDVLVLRHMATGSETEIGNESARSIESVTIAPDSDFVYYVATVNGESAVYRLPFLGGARERVIDDAARRIRFAGRSTRAVFVRDSGGKSRVVVTDVRDGGESVVAEESAPMYAPDVAWTSDGRIAYVRGDKRTGKFDVAVVDPATKRETWRTRLGWYYIQNFTALPDGDYLVAANAKEGGRLALYRVDGRSGAATKLTQDLSRYESISVAADGRTGVTVQFNRIMSVWLSVAGEAPRQLLESYGDAYGIDWWAPDRALYATNASGRWDLMEIDPATARVEEVTKDDYLDYYPTASSDGRRIAFISSRGGTQGARNVWELDRATRRTRRLTTGAGELFPRLSADGRTLVFTSYATGVYRVHRRDLESGTERVLPHDNAYTGELSPDGKAVALLVEEGGGWKLVVGERELALPRSVYGFGVLQWRGDGKALFYVDREEGSANVWEIVLATGARRRVTAFGAGHIESFSVSPDGARIVVIRGAELSNAVQVTLE